MKKYLMALLIIGMSVLLTSCGMQKYELNLTDYMEVTFEGEDGNGTASICLNDDSVFENLKSKEDSIVSYYDMKDDIELYVTPNNNLKNGDTVEIGATINSDKNGKNRLLLVSHPKNIKVTGLD